MFLRTWLVPLGPRVEQVERLPEKSHQGNSVANNSTATRLLRAVYGDHATSSRPVRLQTSFYIFMTVF